MKLPRHIVLNGKWITDAVFVDQSISKKKKKKQESVMLVWQTPLSWEPNRCRKMDADVTKIAQLPKDVCKSFDSFLYNP